MALTDSEKGEAIYFLGYPAKTLVAGSIDYSRRVAERFENLPDHFEVRIRKTMTRLRAVDEKMDDAVNRYAVKDLDGIQLNENERSQLIAERNRLLLQLSHLLDLPPVKKGGLNIGVCI